MSWLGGLGFFFSGGILTRLEGALWPLPTLQAGHDDSFTVYDGCCCLCCLDMLA